MSEFKSVKIDSTNPDDVSNKVTDEKETRRKFLTVAHWAGRERDMLVLFGKYDKLQRETEDADKKRDLAKIGAIEVYKLLGECFAALKGSGALVIPGLDAHRGELWVDGELVYKDK
jgi:hypothetical protein